MFLALLISGASCGSVFSIPFNTHKHQDGFLRNFTSPRLHFDGLFFWEQKKRRKGTYGFVKDEILFGYRFHRTIYSCFMGTKSKCPRSLVKLLLPSIKFGEEMNSFPSKSAGVSLEKRKRVFNVRPFSLETLLLSLLIRRAQKICVIRARSDKTTKVS
jgi:hypothetical protein